MCARKVEMLPNFFQSSKNTERIGQNTNPRRETIINLKVPRDARDKCPRMKSVDNFRQIT